MEQNPWKEHTRLNFEELVSLLATLHSVTIDNLVPGQFKW